MPLYEYHCTQCGYRFEKIQKFNAEADTVCPKCGGVLERPLAAPALQFKGAGWYVNDYAPKGGSGSADKSAAEGKGAAGSDAKPAADSKPATESKPAATESATKASPTTSTSSSN